MPLSKIVYKNRYFKTISNFLLISQTKACNLGMIMRFDSMWLQLLDLLFILLNFPYVFTSVWTLLIVKRIYKYWYWPFKVWFVVFNVPSTTMSFRDGAPIYCPLRKKQSSVFTPSPSWIEPRVDVAWQSNTQPAAPRQLHDLLDITSQIFAYLGTTNCVRQTCCLLCHHLT